MKLKVWFVYFDLSFYRSRDSAFLRVCGIPHSLNKNIFKWFFTQFFNTILFSRSLLVQLANLLFFSKIIRQRKLFQVVLGGLEWKIFWVAQPCWATLKSVLRLFSLENPRLIFEKLIQTPWLWKNIKTPCQNGVVARCTGSCFQKGSACSPVDFVFWIWPKSWEIIVPLCGNILSIIREKGESKNGGSKKTKHAKFPVKQRFLTPWYAMCAYRRVRNVHFSGNLACFVFLLPPFWGPLFCLFTDNVTFCGSREQLHKCCRGTQDWSKFLEQSVILYFSTFPFDPPENRWMKREH